MSTESMADDLPQKTAPTAIDTDPDRYLVIARLSSNSKRVRPVPVELGQVDVELTPGAEMQRITIHADPAQIQRALAALAQW